MFVSFLPLSVMRTAAVKHGRQESPLKLISRGGVKAFNGLMQELKDGSDHANGIQDGLWGLVATSTKERGEKREGERVLVYSCIYIIWVQWCCYI